MYNLYQDKSKDKVEKRTLSTASTRFSAKSEALELNSKDRKDDWIKRNIDTELATKLQEGTCDLSNAIHHQFRDYIPYANVYTRQYVPEKERVLINTLQYFKGHYIQEPYDSSSPSIQKSNYLRKQLKEKELHHPIR